jgi:hypothetical protein
MEKLLEEKHATINELLGVVFSMRFALRLYRGLKNGNQANTQIFPKLTSNQLLVHYGQII